MGISKRSLRFLALASAALTAFAMSQCAASGTCLRISDCDDGMTCAANKCVPDMPDDGGDGGDADDEASTIAVDSGTSAIADTGASGDTGTIENSEGGSTSDAGAADAGPTDASDAG